MTELASPEIDIPAGRRFQFSLWTMLVLVTGLSVLLSLVAWRASLGSLIAIPVVSIWWTIAAIRAGRRRLAYYLVTPAMGVIICLLLSTPLTPLTPFTENFLRDYRPSGFGVDAWMSVWPMCLATLATAVISRRWIRVRSTTTLAMTGIASAYVAALVLGFCFLVIQGATVIVSRGFSPLFLLGLAVWAVIAAILSLVLATLSLHVAGPAGIAFCFILRWIDPPENDLNEAERRLLRIVDELRAEGFEMITDTTIFSREEGDEETLASHLAHLEKLGILQWDHNAGLRHKT